jgi:hypothetical protein
MDIKSQGTINKTEWNNLVLSSRQARFYQMAEYQEVIREVFGYKPYYLILSENNEAFGVLPLYVVKTLFYRKLESVPFAEYGGIISNRPQSIEFPKLIEYVRVLMADNKLDYLQVNGGLGIEEGYMQDNFLKLNFYNYAELDLSAGESGLWEAFDYQVKKAVNKALREKLECFQEASYGSVKKFFYPLYLKSHHRLLSPPLSIKYFYTCLKYFNDKMKIFFVRDGKKVIAALLGFACGDRVYIQYIASDEKAHHKRAVDLVHWEFIKWAVNNSIQYFDFGPARYEGQLNYKLKWAVKLRQYNYYYLFKDNRQKQALPEPLTPDSGNLQFIKKIWGLQPVFVQRLLGPRVRYNLAK